MGKKYKGKDIFDELETKEKSPIIPIAIFLCVVTILGVITTIGINLLEEHTNIDIPWIDNKKKPSNNKVQSSRDQMELTVPRFSSNKVPKEDMDSYLDITKITKTNGGFLFTFSLQSNVEDYATVEAKQITLDGFYFTTTFAISDKLDYSPEGRKLPAHEQKPTTCEFLIKKTELDDIDMFGFNKISIVYDISSPNYNKTNKEYFLKVNNDFGIVNERKGLINIDKKNEVEVNYYKIVTATDATYIYFDFKNSNKFKDIDIYVKELIINSEVYDMSTFKAVSHRNSREYVYLKIPTKDIPRVNTMKVKFFLVEVNEKGERSFYITNEYSKAY